MIDPRPKECRFRLKDEGKAYPRSSCQACGRGIASGLGKECADHWKIFAGQETGGKLLAAWITQSGRRYQWVAEAVGLAQAKTIKRYIRSNECPRSMAMAIELLTGGDVPADTWEWK